MRRISGWAVGAMILATAVTGSACGSDRSAEVTSPPITAVPGDADRPTPGGEVVRRCGSHYAAEFDPGLGHRTVVAGPVSLVAFRMSAAPDGIASVRNFKVMVRLEAGAEATLETVTAGTALAYDRARFNEANVYQLADGEPRVRFVGCPDGPAIFNGGVLTTGPTTVDLDVIAGGRAHHVQVTAFGG